MQHHDVRCQQAHLKHPLMLRWILWFQFALHPLQQKQQQNAIFDSNTTLLPYLHTRKETKNVFRTWMIFWLVM